MVLELFPSAALVEMFRFCLDLHLVDKWPTGSESVQHFSERDSFTANVTFPAASQSGCSGFLLVLTTLLRC